MKKDSFARLVAALAAGILLVVSFCSFGISAASDRTAARHAEASDASHAGLGESVSGEASRAVQQTAAAERRNDMQGETKRGSKTYRRSYTRSLPNQYATLRRLLIPALVAMGMSSAVVARTIFMRPHGDADVQGRPTAESAGLPRHSFPHSIFVAALALMIIASSLAAPNQLRTAEGRSSSTAPESAPEPLSSTAAAATSEVTTRDATTPGQPFPIRLSHKGKLFTVYMSSEDARRAGPKLLQELQETLDHPEVSGGPPDTPIRFFLWPDGSEAHLFVSQDVKNCSACVESLKRLGEKVGEYEGKLEEEGAEELLVAGPVADLAPVQYEFQENKTKCTIGRGWPDKNGGFKDGTAVVRFFLGDTDFEVLLPKRVESTLRRGFLLRFVEILEQWKPKITPLNEGERRGSATERMTWGYGSQSVGFETPVCSYTAFVPREIAGALKRANNGAWEDLSATYRATFMEVKKALVRQSLQLK